MPHFIYILGRQSDLAIFRCKIGKTSDIYNRLNVYNTSAPYDDAILVHSIFEVSRIDKKFVDDEDLSAVEKHFHDGLYNFSSHPDKKGEWFKFTDEAHLTASIQHRLEYLLTQGFKLDGINVADVIKQFHDKHNTPNKIYGYYGNENRSETPEPSETDEYPADEPVMLPPTFRDEKNHTYNAEITRELAVNSRCLIKAPTGFGKTHLAYLSIKQMNEALPPNELTITLALTPRRNLASQLLADKYIANYFPTDKYAFYEYSPEISKFGSSERFRRLRKFIKDVKHDNKHVIITACYQSCDRLAPRFVAKNIKINMLFCDEAHLISNWALLSKEHHRILLAPNSTVVDKIIFATATPNIDMCSPTFSTIFGKCIEHVQIYELINEGILSNFDTIIKTTESKVDLASFIVECMIRYNKRKGVIYVNSQTNAKKLYAIMKRQFPDFKTFIYISDTLTQSTFNTLGYRDIVFHNDHAVLDKWKASPNPSIIISCNKLSYGYDDYNIDLICFGDSRQSDEQIRQIVGRGMRMDHIEYSNKLLHIILPVYIGELLAGAEEAPNAEYEKIANYLQFILSECGKDIIDGRIALTKVTQPPPRDSSNSPSANKYIGDIIPPKICAELSSSAYGKFHKFMGFLRNHGVHNEASYSALREKPEESWMPDITTIRQRYKKFSFQALDAPENAGYYATLEECEGAYEAIKQDTILELGGMVKVKKMLKITFEDKLAHNIKTRDSKIPANKYLFYYDTAKK